MRLVMCLDVFHGGKKLIFGCGILVVSFDTLLLCVSSCSTKLRRRKKEILPFLFSFLEDSFF